MNSQECVCAPRSVLSRINSVVPMIWARSRPVPASPCPPDLSATSTTSSWTAFSSSAPPVRTPMRARKRAPTARAALLPRAGGERLLARSARARHAKVRPKVWRSRRANRCRGTQPTRAREPGCACCPRRSRDWRPPYLGYRRTPSSPSWTRCAWRPATSRISGRFWLTTSMKTDIRTQLTWWDSNPRVYSQRRLCYPLQQRVEENMAAGFRK